MKDVNVSADFLLLLISSHQLSDSLFEVFLQFSRPTAWQVQWLKSDKFDLFMIVSRCRFP